MSYPHSLDTTDRNMVQSLCSVLRATWCTGIACRQVDPFPNGKGMKGIIENAFRRLRTGDLRSTWCLDTTKTRNGCPEPS